MSTLDNNTDQIVIGRSGQDYLNPTSKMYQIQDNDFLLIHRAGSNYRAKWADIKSQFGAIGIAPDLTSASLTEIVPGGPNRFTSSDFSIQAIAGDLGAPAATLKYKAWVEGGINIRPQSQPVVSVYTLPDYATGSTATGGYDSTWNQQFIDWIHGRVSNMQNWYSYTTQTTTLTLGTPIPFGPTDKIAIYVSHVGGNSSPQRFLLNNQDIWGITEMTGGNGYGNTADITSVVRSKGITQINTIGIQGGSQQLYHVFINGIAINSGPGAKWLRWNTYPTWQDALATAVSGSVVDSTQTKSGTREYSYATNGYGGTSINSVLPPAVFLTNTTGTWGVGDIIEGTPQVIQGTKRFLVFNESGQVLDLSATDPGWKPITAVGGKAYVKFLGSLPNGLTPDATFQAGCVMTGSAALINDVGTSSRLTNSVTPTA